MITRRIEETESVVVLELARTDGKSLPRYDAGAHVDVHLGSGLVRQYSLSGDPANHGHYRLAVLKESNSRGGSTEIHREFMATRALRIGAPRNLFPLIEAAPYSVLIAGGIGVTPLLAMAYRLHSLGRDFSFHYCTRSRSAAAFHDELANAEFRDRVRFYYDDMPENGRLDVAHALANVHAGSQMYVCGPEGFMKFVLAEADRQKWPSSQAHQEYFSRSVGDQTANGEFVVEARRSGITLTIHAGQSIAEELYKRGVNVQLSCEQGICGTCLTDVIEGIPDHRDLYQTDAEKESNLQMTICCSRAKTPLLVLDI